MHEGADIPESVECSGASLGRRLDCEEGYEADERPQNQGSGLAHAVGHNGQECGTADSRKIGDVSRAKNHDNVEHPTQSTGTDDGDKDGYRCGNGGSLHFLTDMGS